MKVLPGRIVLRTSISPCVQHANLQFRDNDVTQRPLKLEVSKLNKFYNFRFLEKKIIPGPGFKSRTSRSLAWSSMWAKFKVIDLVYNRREIWDPDRGWCHRHSSVKLFWLQPMAPLTSRDPLTATKKALHQCGGENSSCSGPYPMAACPEFHV